MVESKYIVNDENDDDVSEKVLNISNTSDKVEFESEEEILLEVHPDFPKAKKNIKTFFLFIFLIGAIIISINAIRTIKSIIETPESLDSTYLITTDDLLRADTLQTDDAQKIFKKINIKYVFNENFNSLIRFGIRCFLIMEFMLFYKSEECKETSFKFFKNKLKYKYVFKKEKEINYREILHIIPQMGYSKKSTGGGKIILGTRVNKNLIREKKKKTLLYFIAPVAVFFICVVLNKNGLLFLFLGIPFIFLLQIGIISGKIFDLNKRTPDKININNVENVEDTYKKIKEIIEG